MKTWVYRLTYNCALDLIRSRQRRMERQVPGAGSGEEGERDVLAEKLLWLQPLALEHGFHLATRLQIQQFGNRRGT